MIPKFTISNSHEYTHPLFLQDCASDYQCLARNTKHHKMAIFATVLGDIHLLSQSNMPRPAHAPAIALAAIDFRWDPSDFLESKSLDYWIRPLTTRI